MHMQRQVRLRVLPVVPAPAVYGLLRPAVLVPERLIVHGFNQDELRAIFIHELTHIQRGDLWIKLLQTILQVVYFYNPLIWLANARIRRVREQAVDETVLVTLGVGAGELYPETLLEVAGWAFDRPMPGLRLLGVMETRGALTERIKIMLNKPIPSTQKISAIGMMALALLAVFLLPMAWADEPSSLDTVPASTNPPEATVDESAVSYSDTEAVADFAPVEAEELVLSVTDEAKPMQSLYGDRGPNNRAQDRARADIAKRKAEIRALEVQIERLQSQLRRQLAALQEEERGLTRQGSNAVPQPGTPRATQVPSSADAPSALNRARNSRRTTTGSFSTSPSRATTRSSSGSTSRPTTPSSSTSMFGPTQNAPAYGVQRYRRPVDGSEELRNELRAILPELLREMLPQLLKEAMTEAAHATDQIDSTAPSSASRYRSTTPNDAYGRSRTGGRR